MLEINLLPENLKKKKKKRSLSTGLNIPLEIVVGLGGGLIGLLIFVHIVLLGTNMAKLSQHKGLKSKWKSMEPQKKQVDSIVQNLRELQKKHKSINEITGDNQIRWALKLNILSDVLPRGVWFKKIAYDGTTFFIDGSAISREQNEMINVHNLTANLKEKEGFLKSLADLEISSIQSRQVKGTEIADFLITAQVKK